MLIVNNAEFASKVIQHTRADALPITIKVKYQDQEITLNEYSNLEVITLIELLSQIFKLEKVKTSVKLIEETRIIRVDTQIFKKETLELP